ncbi:MAG TPA: STAS domain-containing protein [Burkholderiales bacterium]|jgi:anti-anti-sigma regulatory factor|nr:STAS domain-containing protein [Burkholderiales bacterium]
MAITLETSAGRCKAVVQGNMTIYEAAADKTALLGALADATEIEIDLSSVAEMDTAGLQVLILVKRESLQARKPLRLTGHSEASLDVLDRYNLAGYFGDPVFISPRKQKKTARIRSRAARRRT